MKKLFVVSALIAFAIFLAGTVTAEQSPRKNPYEGNNKAADEGAGLFRNNCMGCHGEGGKGDICPDLTTRKKKFGDSDQDLYTTISKGRPGGMPNWENILGAERIWKVITYIRSIEKQ